MLEGWLSYRMGTRGAQLVTLLLDFLEAPTREQSVHILQAHPYLLDKELAELLYANARGGERRQPGDGAAVDLLNTATVLLHLCVATLDPAAALEQLRPSNGQS